MSVAFNHESDRPASPEDLARDFEKYATDALASRDESAIFNSALAFAQERGLRSHVVTHVLERMRRHPGVIPALRAWVREARAALGELEVAGLADVVVNESLSQHAAETRDEGWRHAELSKELSVWFDVLNAEFFDSKLPPSPISIERTSIRNLGWYRIGRDGLALRHRININEVHIDKGPAQRIAVLAHEMVHEWEEVLHGRVHGGSYHTKLFREKAAEIGIPTNSNGHYCGISPTGRFATLLRLKDVSFEITDVGRAMLARPASRSRLVKWRCNCTSVWASSGVGVEGDCRRCGFAWTRSA